MHKSLLRSRRIIDKEIYIMTKQLTTLLFLLLAHYASAAELYTQEFAIPTKNPYLRTSTTLKEGTPLGPAETAVVDNTFAILDSWGSGLVFYDNQGNFLKRISLPGMAHYQHIVRGRDKSLFVLGRTKDGPGSSNTIILRVQNEMITEKATHKISKDYIDNIVVDDNGLYIDSIKRDYDDDKLMALYRQNCEECMQKFLDDILIKVSINPNCISCKPKPTHGINVNGLLYRINFVINPSLAIGNKKIYLKFYQECKHCSLEIIQVDQDSTAWIENSINNYDHVWLSYMWKVNKEGKVLAIYRFASDTEERGTLWPTLHEIMVSNDGAVYAITSDKKQIKFRRLKAFSLKEMQDIAQKLDPILIAKSKVDK